MVRQLRSQATMEYLMAYGWSVLVILFIGVALWELGIFDTRPGSVTVIGFSKIKLQPSGTALTAGDGVFTGTFSNGVGGKVTIKAVRLLYADNGSIICCSHVEAGSGCSGDSGIDIAGKTAADFRPGSLDLPKVSAGDNFLVKMGVTDHYCNVLNSVKGQGYNVKVEIDYDTASGRETVPHTESGVIKGPFE